MKNAELIKFILNAGADINAKTNEGETALHLGIIRKLKLNNKSYFNFQATFYRNMKIVKLLLNYSADITVKNSQGATVLHYGIILNILIFILIFERTFFF